MSIQLVTLIGAILGVLAVFSGVYQYRQSKKIERQKLLFDLIEEYDNSSASGKIKLAKDILDDIVPERRKNWNIPDEKIDGKVYPYYHKSNLKEILRNHYPNDVKDTGEMEIRESFDVLLDFFGKLYYLLKIGLIKNSELLYFSYFIEKATDDEEVTNYALIYKFKLFISFEGHLREQNLIIKEKVDVKQHL